MYNDSPIKFERQDKLNRSEFAKSLAKSINNIPKNRNSIVIGLMGGWGTGKSSLLNLIEYEIRYDVNIVRFNPWNYYSQQTLFTSFFDELTNTLSFNNQIKTKFQKYKNKICAAGISLGSSVVPQVGALTNFISDSEPNTLNDIKKELDDIFKKQRKTVVIIDDIDRLNPNEVKQIFQLVKSLADFPNMVYVLAFDRDYVNYALKEWNPGKEYIHSEDFIDKIIQVPLTIPKFDDDDLFNIFKLKFYKVLNNHNPDKDEFNISKLYICLLPYFKNIREINRFCNAIDFYLYSMDEKIWIYDFSLITALQVFEKDVYDKIKYRKGLLTGEFKFYNLSEELEEYYKKDLRCFLNQLFSKTTVKQEYAVKNILSDLFPKVNNILFSSSSNKEIELKKSKCGVMKEDYFDLYFTFDSTNKLSKSLIKSIIKSINRNSEDLKNNLLKINEMNLLNSLLDNLKDHANEFTVDGILNLMKIFISDYRELFAKKDFQTDNAKIEKAIYAILDLFNKSELSEETFIKTILESENNYFKTHISWDIYKSELVSNELLSKLKEENSKFLNEYFEKTEFLKIEHVKSYVWFWRDFSDFDRTNKYITNLNDINLINFIRKFIEPHFRPNNYKVQYVSLKNLVELSSIKKRFENLTSIDELSDEQKSTIELFLENYPKNE